VLTILLVTGILGILAYYVARAFSTVTKKDVDDFNTMYRWKRRTLITLIFVGIGGLTFIPTTKQMIFIIAGGKTLDYVSKDQSLRKIPGQVTEITTEWLDNKLKEIQADVKQEAGIE
jgi:hypothetical protein